MRDLLKYPLMVLTTIAPLAAQKPSFTKVADTATPVPNGTGNFATFSNMVSVDATGNVAFSEANGTTNNGIYLSSLGILSRVADLNSAIPGGTGNFTGFSFFGNGIEAGRLAFRGNGNNSQAGIYAYASGSLIKIADTNSAIPGGTGTFTSFGTAYVDGTSYAFIGPGDSGQQGLYVSNGSTITRIADNTTSVPGIGGTYGWSAQVGFDEGNLAFWASVTGGASPGTSVGGYSRAGGLVTLASLATEVPGTGTTFTGFSSPVDLSGTTVAFRGQYGMLGQGIFATNLAGGAINTIADLSTAVPGNTGTFTQLQIPNISNGRIAFQGGFTSGSGIYVYQNSALQKIIDTSDLLDGKTISSFGLSENSLAGDYLAFRVNFTDSSVGIYRTSFAPEVVVRKPDALIKIGSGRLAGNDVYNTTGASQSKTKSAKPGRTITFGISIQNDGTAADGFTVKATGNASNKYMVTYYRGKTNITAKVVAGTYKITSLAPGASSMIKAKVRVKSTARVNSKLARLVTVSSTGSAGKKDAVKLIARRSR
jgi:hypothetical protein